MISDAFSVGGALLVDVGVRPRVDPANPINPSPAGRQPAKRSPYADGASCTWGSVKEPLPQERADSQLVAVNLWLFGGVVAVGIAVLSLLTAYFDVFRMLSAGELFAVLGVAAIPLYCLLRATYEWGDPRIHGVNATNTGLTFYYSYVPHLGATSVFACENVSWDDVKFLRCHRGTPSQGKGAERFNVIQIALKRPLKTQSFNIEVRVEFDQAPPCMFGIESGCNDSGCSKRSSGAPSIVVQGPKRESTSAECVWSQFVPACTATARSPI